MTSELIPFIDALQEVVRDAGLVLLEAAGAETTRGGVARYNAVSLHLISRIPDVATVYRPLSVEAYAGQLRLAARDVAAFVEALPEHPEAPGPGRAPPGPPDEPVVLLKPPGRSSPCLCG
jgi:hypothetical protein